MADFDKLFDAGDVDAFLNKAKEKCQKKVRGKHFAGMEQEDVIQEILIKIYRKLDKYDSEKAKVSTYINSIMDNMIKDCFRYCGTDKNLSLVNAVPIEEDYEVDFEKGSMGSGIQVGRKDINFLENEILIDYEYCHDLSDRDRKIFLLHYRGYSKAEIANELGLSKSRLTQIWNEIVRKLI
ncbi:sigma-70 family RNA polymerase sigma factor [Cytobacillus sp. Hm23]